MTKTQEFFYKILPRSWAEDMERESRDWKLICRHCDFQESIWDRGGIRWKAAGKPRRSARCSACGKVSMMKVEKVSAVSETADQI